MSETYRFQPPTSTSAPGGALLAPGDYVFVVTSCEPPHLNTKSGNLVCSVELSIQPDGQKIFANPWAGKDKNGVVRDDIAIFLVAISRAPKPGAEPDWERCVGGKGRCKLKVEDDLNGVPRNRVAYFHVPKVAGPAASTAEFEQARSKAVANAGGNIDLGREPDDIPF
jgi:hypothetical protein